MRMHLVVVQFAQQQEFFRQTAEMNKREKEKVSSIDLALLLSLLSFLDEFVKGSGAKRYIMAPRSSTRPRSLCFFVLLFWILYQRREDFAFRMLSSCVISNCNGQTFLNLLRNNYLYCFIGPTVYVSPQLGCIDCSYGASTAEVGN